MPADRTLALANKGSELARLAGELAGRVRPPLSLELGRLVRSMNCYYSNLIEGHPTHPIDIDRALAGLVTGTREQRNLQLEAVAHIAVEGMIDEGRAPRPTMSVDFLRWLHREFCIRLPDELLWVTNPDTGKRSKVVPGEFRDEFVAVGDHIAPPPEEIGPLLDRLLGGYVRVSGVERYAAVAAAHHRLLWVHPFLDGNGRVARLFSHALLKDCGLGAELWSVSRGLARKVEDYKALLRQADEPRRGDLDGRGNLSDKGLQDFCAFFLDTCIDQVRFMADMLKPEELGVRIKVWADEEVAAGRLPKGAWPLLREALLAGTFERGRAGAIAGYGERQGRTILTALVDRRVLTADGPKKPVRLAFPAELADRWIPTLYPADARLPAGA